MGFSRALGPIATAGPKPVFFAYSEYCSPNSVLEFGRPAFHLRGFLPAVYLALPQPRRTASARLVALSETIPSGLQQRSKLRCRAETADWRSDSEFRACSGGAAHGWLASQHWPLAGSIPLRWAPIESQPQSTAAPSGPARGPGRARIGPCPPRRHSRGARCAARAASLPFCQGDRVLCPVVSAVRVRQYAVRCPRPTMLRPAPPAGSGQSVTASHALPPGSAATPDHLQTSRAMRTHAHAHTQALPKRTMHAPTMH